MERKVPRISQHLTRRQQEAVALALYNDFNELLTTGLNKTEATKVVMKRYGYRTANAIFAVRRRVEQKLGIRPEKGAPGQ